MEQSNSKWVSVVLDFQAVFFSERFMRSGALHAWPSRIQCLQVSTVAGTRDHPFNNVTCSVTHTNRTLRSLHEEVLMKFVLFSE